LTRADIRVSSPTDPTREVRVGNPFLVGKRLYRPLELDDAPTLVGWLNDPRVNRTLQLHGPMSEMAERDWIERTVRSKEGMAGVIMTRDQNRMISVSGLGLINWRNDVHLMAVLRDEWSRQGRTGSRANDAEPRRSRRSTGARRSVRSSTSTGRG